MNYNKVILAGNLTRQPELSYTPRGSAVCKFGIAVNRQWKDDADQIQQETTFVEVSAWGKMGENIARFFNKGSSIFIEGRLHLETWTDKATNSPRSKLTAVAETFQFPERKSAGDQPRTQQAPPERPRTTSSQALRKPSAPPRNAEDDFGTFSDGPITDGMDDEIPF